jgi:hypothetical protein
MSNSVVRFAQLYASGLDLVFDPEHKAKLHTIENRGRVLVRGVGGACVVIRIVPVCEFSSIL